jgi:hypothetical protein
MGELEQEGSGVIDSSKVVISKQTLIPVGVAIAVAIALATAIMGHNSWVESLVRSAEEKTAHEIDRRDERTTVALAEIKDKIDRSSASLGAIATSVERLVDRVERHEALPGHRESLARHETASLEIERLRQRDSQVDETQKRIEAGIRDIQIELKAMQKGYSAGPPANK